MNERIKELAQQAELAELYDRYVEYCMKNADDDIMDYDTSVKKFADLLIKETTNVIIIGHKGHMNPALATDSVKQHFGVKE